MGSERAHHLLVSIRISILHVVESLLSVQISSGCIGRHCSPTRECNIFEITQPCYSTGLISSAVHGNWTDWEAWNLCSVTCAGGTQSRSRTCTNPPPRNGGRGCSGESKDVRSCNENPCPSKYLFSRVVNDESINMSLSSWLLISILIFTYLTLTYY